MRIPAIRNKFQQIFKGIVEGGGSDLNIFVLFSPIFIYWFFGDRGTGHGITSGLGSGPSNLTFLIKKSLRNF